MKIKHKIGFVALITLIDIFVIVLVVINNDNTNIQNDVKTKTSANVLTITKSDEKLTEEIVDTNTIEEETTEEDQNTEIENTDNQKEEPVETPKIDNVENIQSTEVVNETNVQEENTASETINISYDDMTIEEKVQALNEGTLALNYSGLYTESNDRLTKSRGALYYNGHKETYYSERVLPGTGLNIPGRHVADDGTVRDGDGYICVAADYSYMPKGSILITSLGPAKVYDTGCSYGTIDIYVNW